MIYTEMTKLAMKVAYKAHQGQTDKAGLPYIYHPVHLAEQMTDELTTIIALLHDVAEDTDVSLDDLKNMGFSDEALAALKLMKHEKTDDYMDYVRKLKQNPAARTVKMADLEHNSDVARLPEITEESLKRIEKYRRATEILHQNDME